MMKKLIWLFLITFVHLTFGQSDVLKQAEKFYQNKDYQSAIDLWEQSAIENPSKEIYFNLGNAYYKLQNAGKSIYNYEKALKIDPEFNEALSNLKFAQKLNLDNFETKKRYSGGEVFYNMIGFFETIYWAYIALIFSMLVLVSFVAYFFLQTSTLKRAFLGSSVLFFVLAALSVFFALYMKQFEESQRLAIVLDPKVEIKQEPRASAKNARVIHSGTKVSILEQTSKWYKVALPNLEQGWIEKTSLGEI